MARTGLALIKIRNNGTPLGVVGFTTIDLTGGFSATDAGNAVATLTGSAGTGTYVATDVVSPVTSGANITLDLTTLSHTFVAIEVVFRNGQGITPVSSWSLVGNTITVFNADNTEAFMVQYSY